MAAAAIPLVAASTLYGMSTAYAEGEQAERIAAYKAKLSMATGSRKAVEESRRGDIVLSNARAAMAAGGSVTTDAGAIETLTRIENEAQYNSLTAMYEGKVGHDVALYEGKMAKARAKSKMIQTALSGASSAAFMAYSPGGSPASSVPTISGREFLNPQSSNIRLTL